MSDVVVVIVASVALLMSVIVLIYALFRDQSSKKNYFVPMQAMIIVYLFGYFIEITSANIEEAYAGAKLLYTGVFFVVPLVFFFIADYCDVKLRPLLVKAPMMLAPAAAVVTLWIAQFDRLVSPAYRYNASVPLHLYFISGALYYFVHSYIIFCLVLSVAALAYRMKAWKEKYRRQLNVLLACLIFPLAAEVIYLISHVYLTPHSMVIMSFCFSIGVARINILDIISIATISAMEYIRDGFILLDNENHYLYSNQVAALFLPELKKLKKGESVSSVKSLPPQLDDMEIGSFVFSTDNDTRYFKASVSPVFSQNQRHIAKTVFFNDITESVMMMKNLEDAAYLDSLTGIYNRKKFVELARVNVERELRLNNPIYTAMLDLDFFKHVNDTYGHTAGDLVLIKTATIIRQTIRSYDLVGRYGGEEFILLVTGLEMPDAAQIMERIRANIENTAIIIGDIEIRITCSIGLSQWVSGETMETSVKKADEALYTAKNSSRNRVYVY